MGSYKHRSKLGVQSIVAYHWLSYRNLSLAKLLSEEEENLFFFFFSSLPGQSGSIHMQSSSLLLGLQWQLVVGHESSHCWPPASILNEISFYWFSQSWGCLLLSLIFSIIVEALVKAVRQEQEKKKTVRIWKEKTKLPLSIDDVFAYVKNIQKSF